MTAYPGPQSDRTLQETGESLSFGGGWDPENIKESVLPLPQTVSGIETNLSGCITPIPSM